MITKTEAIEMVFDAISVVTITPLLLRTMENDREGIGEMIYDTLDYAAKTAYQMSKVIIDDYNITKKDVIAHWNEYKENCDEMLAIADLMDVSINLFFV